MTSLCGGVQSCSVNLEANIGRQIDPRQGSTIDGWLGRARGQGQEDVDDLE